MRTTRVTQRGAERWSVRRHPWIYRGDVIEPPPGEVAGAVRVVDARDDLVGMALWSPSSSIALRMLTRGERPIDGGFWRERLRSALARREVAAPDATAYRLVHGEADGMPSLVVDRYDAWLVVQLLSAGLEAHRAELVEALGDVFAPAGILARNDPPVRGHERLPRVVELLAGSVPEAVEIREAGVRYVTAPWTGQKTGAFLDQRENRVRAGTLARGRALDCFAYHGSFALQLARRADEVVAVDSSADALARAASNAARNGFGHVRTVQANVFEFLRAGEAAGTSYDTIVLDPPAFAKRKDAVAAAAGGYKEINLRAMRLLAPGGTLCTFSCSYHFGPGRFRAMLESAAADAGRSLRWIEWRGAAPDHPEIVQIPETAYLKGALLEAVE
jgi:23S rRNA (cytosine1962-C5)-methyltransferase